MDNLKEIDFLASKTLFLPCSYITKFTQLNVLKQNVHHCLFQMDMCPRTLEHTVLQLQQGVTKVMYLAGKLQ